MSEIMYLIAKLRQKFLFGKPFHTGSFKRLITHLVLLSFIHQNLAFATHSIIELDFKDSETPQRLHVIPRLSNVSHVSHIEIDTEQQQVVVYTQGQQVDKPDDLQEALPPSESVPKANNPILIPQHNIVNLPWELEPEKLTLFILQQTAWLSPLDEDGYKLEFRGSLLGGGGSQSTGGGGGGSGGGRVTITPYCPSNPNWRNDGTPCGQPTSKTNDSYTFGPSKYGGSDNKGGYGSLPPSSNSKDSGEGLWNTFEQQNIPLNRPPSINAYIKKNAFLPKGYIKDALLDDALLKVVLDYNKGLSSPMKSVLEPLFYITRQELRNRMNEVPVFNDYRPLFENKDTQKRLQIMFDLFIQTASPDCWGVGPGSSCFHWGQIQKQNKNGAISKALAPQLLKAGHTLIRNEQERLNYLSQEAFDRLYVETRLLPTIQKFCNYDAYKTYQAFITVDGTGYKPGRDLNEYWQSWLNSKWGEAAKKHPLQKYRGPMGSVRDQATFDRHFVETHLLPTIQEFCHYDAYKTYQAFISNPGTGYKPGRDINEYWQSWLNSKWGEAAKKHPLPKYQLPDTCNPFYGDYEKLTRVQTMINTTTWEAVYDYAGKQGLTKEDVQYVNSKRTESITFDSYMKGVFDDQVLEDWGTKNWRDIFNPDPNDADYIQVKGFKDGDPRWVLLQKIIESKFAKDGIQKGIKIFKDSWQKAVQAYKGDLVKGLKIDKSVENKLTQQLGQPKLADKHPGLRWGDTKGNNQVRVMKGRKDANFECQRNDYVQVRRGGQVIGRNQKEVKPTSEFPSPRENPEAHIPYEEWVNWPTLLGE